MSVASSVQVELSKVERGAFELSVGVKPASGYRLSRGCYGTVRRVAVSAASSIERMWLHGGMRVIRRGRNGRSDASTILICINQTERSLCAADTSKDILNNRQKPWKAATSKIASSRFP